MVGTRVLALLSVVVVAGCAAEGSAPTTSPIAVSGRLASEDLAEPHFVDAAAGAPAISNPVVTFWATKGVDQTARMFYVSRPGHHDSVTFFSLRVRSRSLYRRPDGSTIANGDSVQITLTLVDAEHLVVDCQPSGLLFDPHYPATVRISYANTNPDRDGDGVVMPIDTVLTRALQLWRRESPLAPWLPVPSHEVPEADEVQGDIGGFTGYALAW